MFYTFTKLKSPSCLVIAFILSMCVQVGYSQGCVAIRGGNCGMNSTQFGNNVNLNQGEFMVGTGFRYFKSYRHFRGDHEETHRIEEGTQVINHSYFLDFFVNYGISNRLFANVILPFAFHNRSSMYEHGGNPPNGLGERHETSSAGLSDMRLGVGYWLFNPEKVHNYNYSVGLGIKLPTGNAEYSDLFYNQGSDRDEDREAVVDQSIQLGDGGTGLTLDLQGFHMLSENFFLNATLYYLFNWQATNGVKTRNGNSEFSCPDQYAARLGLFYNTPLTGFSAFFGGRIEGVPASDVFGSSEGYRRPGYVISVEPGITYATGRFLFNFSVPIAVYRNRTQSYQDKERTEQSGVYRHGDAAFADYLINFSASYRFGGKHDMAIMEGAPDLINE